MKLESAPNTITYALLYSNIIVVKLKTSVMSSRAMQYELKCCQYQKVLKKPSVGALLMSVELKAFVATSWLDSTARTMVSAPSSKLREKPSLSSGLDDC